MPDDDFITTAGIVTRPLGGTPTIHAVHVGDEAVGGDMPQSSQNIVVTLPGYIVRKTSPFHCCDLDVSHTWTEGLWPDAAVANGMRIFCYASTRETIVVKYIPRRI